MNNENSKRRTGLQTCEKCGKRVEDLVTRQGFLVSFHIEYVCEKCFKKLEGVAFDDYKEIDYYGFDPKEVVDE